MPLLVAPEWTMDVERGPEWLFIRLHGPSNGDTDGCDLADRIWRKMQQQFAKRLVLELEELSLMRSSLISELLLLQQRICDNGGTIHLSGLSDHNQEVLSICRLDSRFPHYCNREAAVMGARPA